MEVLSWDSGPVAFHITDIKGDMGESTRLNLIQQADGDVILIIRDLESGTELSIEFCTMAGGSHNPVISKKLRELIQALASQEQGG